MIRLLIRAHPLARTITLKWVLMAIAVASFWVGALAGYTGRADIAVPWWALVMPWLPSALFLALAAQNQRCQRFPLHLPVPGPRIWTAHVIALLAASGFMLAGCLGVTHYALVGLATTTSGPEAFAAARDRMPTVWLHAGAWWLLLAAALLRQRPALAEVAGGRRWLGRQLGLVGAGLLGLAVLPPVVGPVGAALPLAAAALLIGRTWREVPPALALAPRDLRAGRHRAAVATDLAGRPWWQRRPLWMVVLQQTSRFPALLPVSAPFHVLVGLWISPAGALLTDGVYLGILFAAIAAYMLFAVVAAPLVRLASLDHLPIGRGRLLACVLLPAVVLMGGGFAAGMAMVATRSPAVADGPLVFSGDPARYGVRLPLQFLAVTWTEPPAQRSPAGQTIEPPVIARLFGDAGPAIYKPYATPEGSSLATCAWQLERAIARVYDRTVPAAVIAERYLTVDADGRVLPRAGGLRLRDDYPDLVVHRFDGMPPLTVLVVIVLFVAVHAAYLACFRPGRSDRARRTAFVGGLVGLMALYLTPFFLDVTGQGSGEVLVALAHGLSDWLVATLPGGPAALWLLVVLVAAAGAGLLRHGFRRAEWPPVREDDSVFDVLG